MKGRPILKQPSSRAHPLKLMLWRASGPGRAERIRDFALGIGPDDPFSGEAPEWSKRAKEIIKFYRKGSDAWASRELERLVAEIARAERDDAKQRREAGTGGKNAGKKKKDVASVWRKDIRPRVERMIKADKSDANIGALLASDAGKAASTVARFAAEVRAKK